MCSFDWKKIRSYNNSQNNAFEELVCQVAREENIENKKSFLRVASPDGGVEGYCILNNGDEYGWQAKFFFSMGDPQWLQLERSFKRALQTHPKLVKYFICLPMDRRDPRNLQQESFMDKWNSKKGEWEQHAQENGRCIEFEYWGSSELLHRLAQEKHAGRRYFWFKEMEFSDEWFKEHIERSIADLGTRYTPELNFELEIAKVFDGIARDDNFKDQFECVYDDLLKKSSKAINSLRDERLTEEKQKLNNGVQQIVDEYGQINFKEVNGFDHCKILVAIDNFQKNISSCRILLEELNEKEKENPETTKITYRGVTAKFDYELYNLRKLNGSVYGFREFIASKTVALSNMPFLILDGEAGIGKSHLLADISKRRLKRGKFSILLLGQHFVSEENPWHQILNSILRLGCDESEFLGALEAKAQSSGSRIIIFIDAINEGKGKYFWKDHIMSFAKSFERYKWLGLVMTIRSSYKKLLVPEELITPDVAVRLTHYGFVGVEYEAAKLFFKNYNIEQPGIPLLHPEFRNPLFLKLFCEGLQKAGLSRIPEGYEGITTIINFYLKSINKRLAEPNRLNYPENVNLVEKAIKLFVQKEIEQNARYLPYEDAFTLIEAELRQYSNKMRFLDELISEGILTKNLFWNRKEEPIEGIYFAYERFEDHLKTSHLLEMYLDKANPENSFLDGQKLFDLIRDENTCYRNKGVVEALSIQLPELTNKELYEVAPHCISFYPVVESFVESLIWRKTETIRNESVNYINKYVIQYQGTYDKFLDTLLLITSNPKHPFNADFLHRHLMKFSLPDRDALWTIDIHDKLHESTSVKRLIDWAWSEEDKSHISDESIRLISKSLAWFLTSSNRILRDSATKSLIALLENRIPVLIKVLKEFGEVNDPYVYERLYAVAYGCALRTADKNDLKVLSEYIYEAIFNKELVYPHILLRDYARGVIEYSIYLRIDLKLDENRIRPPYRSDWPKQIPSDEEIKRYEFDRNSNGFKDYYWSRDEIIYSMQTEYTRIHGNLYGDFGRYVFQSALRNWRDLNPQDLSNLAVKRIIELGYDVEKHGKFDRNINRYANYGRSGSKPERIGKKYQWIALYEILAKVSDNFSMYDESIFSENRPLKYEGPWEPYVRDIDPTMLIRTTGRERWEQHSKHWWFNVSYRDWDSPNQDWIKRTDNLPDPSKLILVKDDSGTEWLILEAYPGWTEPDKLGEEKWEYPRKRLSYLIRSYLVPNNRLKTIIRWAKHKDFWHRQMPESIDRYEIFSREYYWSSAWAFFQKAYYGGGTWREIRDTKSEKTIGKVIVTAERFLWEEEYDCSKDDTIVFLKPCETLYKGLGMMFSQREGELVNMEGQLVCFDPSISNRSLSCLLIRKKDFMEFLKKNDLNVFWTILGEKLIIGGFSYTTETRGQLAFSGVYHLSDDNIVGNMNYLRS
jgi:hypothetical protein